MSRVSKRVNLLIDSNSLTNLSRIEIKRSSRATWLWKYFNIHTSESVKKEFLNGVKKRKSNAKAVGRKLESDKNLVLKTNYIQRIEKGWLKDRYYKKQLLKDDEGERHLVCKAIELVKYRKFNQIILVTDDEKAMRSFLTDVSKDLYFGEIWNSMDLITYMYYAFSEFSHSYAKNAIIDLSSMNSISWKSYRDNKMIFTETDARIAMRTDYFTRLESIRNLRTILN